MKVYVVTHKPCNGPLPPDYEYIEVNAAAQEKFCALTDDTGDQISCKNPNFCELTATYWIWKNDRENDIVGLAHYRRFLTSNVLSSSPKHYVTAKRAEKQLKKYDFLATRRYRTSCTVKEHMGADVREGDLELLRETVAECCPEYLADYDAVLAGHESYLLNMFICTKERWDEYCAWLFSVLFALEPKVDMSGYSDREKRLYGFLGERLFTVYVRHNHLRVKSYYTHLVGVSKRSAILHKIKRILRLSD